jgi:RHS repeat-associated protein
MRDTIRFKCLFILAAMLCLFNTCIYAENNYTVDNIIATETDADEKITVLVENVNASYDMMQTMSADATDENIVTVTFDVTNTSSRAEEFNIYAAAYKQEGALFSAKVQKQILQAGEKRKLLFKVNVPNDGKDTYGKIFVWDNDMLPASEYTPFTIVNENPDKLPDIVLTEDMILSTDMSYNNVTLEGGTIDLNGHKLYVNGNLLQPDGIMYINGGELIVNGDYRIQKQSEETDQYGETYAVYSDSNGFLNMSNENDYVLINGSFHTQSRNSHSSSLTNGVIEIKKDFYQYLGWPIGVGRATTTNFDATSKHKVIFSGNEQQNIQFESTESGFSDVEFKNTNINICSDLRGWVLKRDTVIDNDVNCAIGIAADINGNNGLDLHGYKLEINGNLVQPKGTMYINGGSLVVNGDYRIQTQSEKTDQYGDTCIVYGDSDGILNMTDENDRVLLNGDFYMQSNNNHSQYLQNGVMEINGDFAQKNAFGVYNNFDACENHKVIFSGTEKQNISFDHTYSGFADVEFENTNINICSDLRGWVLKRDTVIDNDVNYAIGIAADINGNNGLDLHGYKLEINGDLIQPNGAMYINGGSLVVNGDYRIQTPREETDQYGNTSIIYYDSPGVLNMTNENDRVLVNGDFYTQSNNSHSQYLQNGIMELKGDFVQKRAYGVYNFAASRNHKVILSGNNHQNVTFESDGSQFNALILTKPYETGYTFSRVPCWNALYQADAVSINYGGQTGAYAPTGNYSQEFTDMTVISAAGEIPIKRTYNSLDEESSVFNQGWTLSTSSRLTDEGYGYKRIKLPDGSTCTFKETDGSFEAMDSRHSLTRNEDGTYVLTSKAQVKYLFSEDGNIISMTDRYGNVTRYETDSRGNVTAMIEPSGRRISLVYTDGKLTSVRDEMSGAAVSYEYSGGNLTKVTVPGGACTYYEYDGSGRLAKILDHDRNPVEEIAYNSEGKVDYVIDSNGNKSTYSYDMGEGKTTITDSNGRQRIQWYDSTFNVTKNQDSEGGITAMEYNMTNGMNRYNEQRTLTDRNGRNTYYERDERGNVTRQSNPDGTYKLYKYDEYNNIISERNENGNYTYYVYDESGTKLLKQAKPLDGVSAYSDSADPNDFAVTAYEYFGDEYSVKGLVKSKTEPEGLITEFDYYDNGFLKTVTVKDTKDGTIGTTEYHYNSMGLVDHEISPDGYKTSYEYDAAGRLVRLAANNGKAVSVIEYDAAGRKVKEVSPAEYALSGSEAVGQTYEYYPSGKVKAQTDALGNTTLFTYDIYGNAETQTLPDGSAYKYEYDGISRKTKEYFRDKNSADFVLISEYSYDVDDLKNSLTTETKWLNETDSITTINTIDFRENLISQQRSDGTVISKTYDGTGNIKTETDANGNTKEYTYDAFGNVIAEKIPFDSNYQYKRYTYDKAGNRLSEKTTNQPSGSAEEYSLTEYGYNSRRMMTSAAGLDNGVIKSTAQYVYDAEGNKVRVYTGLTSLLTVNGIDNVTANGDDDYAVRKYEYDYSGNVVRAVDALGNEELYSYDDNGNRISYTDRNGAITSYIYDTMNRLIEKRCGQSVYRYTYDSVGNKTAISGDYAAGYEYDGRGNLAQEITNDYIKTYSYDLQGNTIGFVLVYNGEEKVNMRYGYDLMGRVSQVISRDNVIAQYEYDSNGNRTSVAYDNGGKAEYAYNKANLLTSAKNSSGGSVISDFAYGYNMDGRQRYKTENGVTESYEYDDLGRLVKAADATYQYDDYNNRILADGQNYSYDKNGRIIGYDYDNNGNLLYDGEHHYQYDNWNRLINADGEAYEYDDLSGRVSAGEKKFVYDGADIVYAVNDAGEQIFRNGIVPISITSNGKTMYYFYNAHGDTVNLTDEVGDLSRSYSYDVFGRERNSMDNDENPLRYAGQYYDESTGNYYMNSRYYDTVSGRFLSQDSFYGSDENVLSLNQYTYCYNDPIQYIDLSGNSVVSVSKTILKDSLTKAGKDMAKEYLKDQYTSAIGCETESKDYFGTFVQKAGKNALKGIGSKAAKKLGAATEFSVLYPVLESGVKNITEEFNASQKENRTFNMSSVIGNTAEGVVSSYVKSAPGVSIVYDMCLDLSNGDIFENLTVKTVTTTIDTVADSMGYDPINWNAGKDLYSVDNEQFSNDYNSFRRKGWSSNTSYWYALSQSYTRKVQRGNSWLSAHGYIR